ncbi:helix-turn-helix domain-containing protein [Hymenobacter nivis]|uniref:DNA-binding protein n=1 Tax=Hymenobacter nivis TaxID=1850093 RepID=A0A502GX50_9BACT|nr:helix-turn-helix domain-containing protein [Hymenobacter nivis]TPG66095.1 DNA-binding protein [Hymenobacter nivis]
MEAALPAPLSPKATVFTVEKLAEVLCISTRSAYELIRQGLINYNCLGKKNYRVTEADVVDYLESTKVRAAA